MVVSAKYLAENVEDVLSAAEGGESIQVERPNKLMLTLVPKVEAAVDAPKAQRVLGAGTDPAMRYVLDNWDELDKEWRASFRDKFGTDDE